jgi:hypothetical protein
MRVHIALFAVITAACANSTEGATGADPSPAPAADSDGGPADGGSGTGPGTGPADASLPPDAGGPHPTKTGVLLFGTGAPIVGLPYSSASGAHTGTTDAAGTFSYEAGAKVSFSLGALDFGAANGADVLAPYHVAGSDACDDTDDVQKLVALLAALDGDGLLANGIQLAAQPAPSGPRKTLAQTSWTDLAALATAMGGKALAAPLDALRAFIGVFDSEAWTPAGIDTFGAAQALLRGQGVATDGTSWIFSGTTGLDRTDLAYATQTSNALAIPVALVLAGSDHIGDVDVWEGKLYAPIEDKGYTAPKVVLYDPSTLTSGTVYSISATLQTAGVPWIAVDGPRGKAYMAEWDPTPAIHVFSLADLSYERAIDIAPTIGRVQGGKVYKGQLYLTVDDDQKHVYKVHLGSGTAQQVLTLGLAGMEQEGLALLARPDGTLLHTLNVSANRQGVDFRHHAITRAPARWAACP